MKQRIGEGLIALLLQVQRVVVFVYFKLFYNLRIRGAKYIPRSGPAIIAPNHQTRYDAFPVGYRVPPPVYCAVDKEYFDKPFLGWWLRTFRGVPMAERRDVEGYRRSLEILRAGHRLIIFPEGFLSKDGSLRRLLPGAARAALTLGVDIVPVTLVGAFEAWPKPQPFPKLFLPMIVKYYPPIRCQVTDKADLKQRVAEVNGQLEKIMKRRLEAWRRLKERRRRAGLRSARTGRSR